MEKKGAVRDTDAGVARRQLEGLRRMSPEERLERTLALGRSADELARAGLRLREGELSPGQIRRRLAEIRLGADLVRRVEAHRATHDERS